MEETKSNPELFDVVILDEYNTREEALRAEYNYQKMHNVVHSDNYINMALASPTGFSEEIHQEKIIRCMGLITAKDISIITILIL